MQVISIITRGRSGALFLQSLLDSHYKIATIPGPFLSDYFSWYKKNKNLSLKSLIYNFVNIHNLIFDCGNDTTDKLGFTKMGKERNEKLSVDTNLFISSFLDFFKENKEISRKKSKHLTSDNSILNTYFCFTTHPAAHYLN